MIASELHSEAAAIVADAARRVRQLQAQAEDRHALDALIADLARAAEVEASRALAHQRGEEQRRRELARHEAAMADFLAPAPF